MIKQIKFRDIDNDETLCGILLDNGGIICACCGGYVEPDDPQFEIVKEYNHWVDFSFDIID